MTTPAQPYDSPAGAPAGEPFLGHPLFTHPDGQQCIWVDDDYFVPYDVGGEGVDCRQWHPGDTERRAHRAAAHLQPSSLTEPEHAEDAEFVTAALRAVDADSAGHWPTVAGILANEVRRLRTVVATKTSQP